MAAVKIKRAILVDGKFYQPGVQEIPDAVLKHPHFAKYIKLGVIVAPDNEEIEKLETPEQRAKRIHEKEIALEAKKQELLKKAQPEPAPKKDEEKPEQEKSEAESAPDDGKKKSKKG